MNINNACESYANVNYNDVNNFTGYFEWKIVKV